MASDGTSGGRTTGNRAANGAYQWVSSSPTPAEVARLEVLFPDVVQVSAAELAEEVIEWENRAVLMRTFHRWIPADAFIREFRRGGISGEIAPISLAFRSYIFRFEEEGVRDQVLQRPWVINGQPVAAEAWSPDFVPAADAISSALLWIRLPNLPIEYWKEEFLREIIAPAGIFVCADPSTLAKNRGGYARVCARVELSSPLRPGSRVRGEKDVFWQQFAYEQMEGICHRCGSIHLSGSCLSPATNESDSSSQEPLYGAWMSASRQRKTMTESQEAGRSKVQLERVFSSPVPRSVIAGGASAQGTSADGWTAQLKKVRRSRARGPQVASKEAASPSIRLKSSEGANGLVVTVAEEEKAASVCAGSREHVPASVEFQSETLKSKFSLSKNPFAVLEQDVDAMNQVGSTEACPGPLKRARPVEYPAPRQITKLDKKKGKGSASFLKSKLVEVQVVQHMRLGSGISEAFQSKDAEVGKVQIILASDSSSTPLTSFNQDQDPGSRLSVISPRENEFQEVMICSTQSLDEDTRSKECLPDSDMADVQGGIPASSSC